MTDPAGRVTQFSHDSSGHLVQITGADGAVEHFEYDAQGRMIRRTDARTKVFQYQYDETGRFIQSTGPTGETRRLSASQAAVVPKLATGVPSACPADGAERSVS